MYVAACVVALSLDLEIVVALLFPSISFPSEISAPTILTMNILPYLRSTAAVACNAQACVKLA